MATGSSCLVGKERNGVMGHQTTAATVKNVDVVVVHVCIVLFGLAVNKFGYSFWFMPAHAVLLLLVLLVLLLRMNLLSMCI